MLEWLGRNGPLHEGLVAAPPSRVLGSAGVAAPLPQRLVLDSSTDSQCTKGDELVVLKRYEDGHFTFYQDSVQTGDPDRAVTAEQLQRMADFYREYGQPVIEDYFGGVSDIDGNGRIIVVVSSMVTSGTAAFVWSGDFFTSERCAASNEGEFIYFSAGVIRGQDEGNWQSLETLVHEMKHVSSLKKSIDRSAALPGLATVYHPSWIEEGTAEIAGNTATRFAWHAMGGPSPSARVNATLMRETGFRSVGGETRILPEFYGMALRLLRTQGYLSSQPNALTHDPTGASADHSVYGSGFHFHRWLGDAFGDAARAPGADADWFLRQNSSSFPPGISGIEQATGRSFSELLTSYTVATLLNDDDFDVPPLNEGFTSIDFASGVELFCFALSQGEYDVLVANLEPGESPPCTNDEGVFEPSGPNGRYPWPVTAAADGTNTQLFGADVFEGTSGNGGLRIHDFVSEGTAGAEVRVEVARSPSDARIVIVRVR